MPSERPARVLPDIHNVTWSMTDAVDSKSNYFQLHQNGVRIASITTNRQMSMEDIKAMLMQEDT